MYQPDEKDIDRLSREAAEHYHAPGKPAWESLQEVLDRELPQQEKKKRRGFFFFFFLLLGLSLTGSVLWFGLHINRNQAQTNQQQTISKASGTDDNNQQSINGQGSADELPAPVTGNSSTPQSLAGAPATTAKASSSSPYAGDEIPASEKASNAVNNTEQKTVAPRHQTSGLRPQTAVADPANGPAATTAKDPLLPAITAITPSNSHKKINKPANRQQAIFTAGSKNSYGNNSSRQKPAADGNLAAGKHSVVAPQPARRGKKISPAPKQPGLAEEGIAANGMASSGSKAEALSVTTAAGQEELTAKDSAAQPAGNAIAGSGQKEDTAASVPPAAVNKKTDAAATAAGKKKPAKNRSINISLVAGMDFSTVKFTHGDNAGYNAGLMAGYQFNRHWAAYTGLIYTKKNYTLDGSDYHPPKHYWTQYVTLEAVDGYCRMWELPLQARYTFNPGAKTAFFANAGLSSYFMKKQQYNYSYKNNMNQQLTAAWSNDSTFKHIFSVLHLSAGIEKPLGKHMNWQIEPYAKIPLGGVGFGNIRLSSFGVNFSVQYRQRIRR